VKASTGKGETVKAATKKERPNKRRHRKTSDQTKGKTALAANKYLEKRILEQLSLKGGYPFALFLFFRQL
jgi:hypothetical protein